MVADASNLGRAALNAVLWDDNPTTLDLLGFDAVVAPVVAALHQADLDPVTIGVHAPWGGGKSSVLNLLAEAKDARWVIVRTTPWEYEDHLDVKGTLIAEVLEGIKSATHPVDQVADRFIGLLRRVSWSRVGIAIAKGAVTMRWSPAELLEAFTPSQDSPQQSMAAFRREFEEVLELLPDVDRVVVLVDDLDRCLPPATVATLEAIKLFLSVKKMAFVIAADQNMVKEAIAASLVGSNRGELFAENYLEKIVQLPVSLPRLSPTEAEAYIALLLVPRDGDAAAFRGLVNHVGARRRANQQPLLGDLDGLSVRPSEDAMRLAAQLNQGLAPSERGNPREIKRFLNAFGVRSQVAEARGLHLEPDVMVKLLLLETRYRNEFDKLVGLPEAERLVLLGHWEAWGRGERDDRPAIVTETTKAWAGSEPRLHGEDLGPYITLAATLAASSLGAALTDEQRKLVRALLDDLETVRTEAIDSLKTIGADDGRKVANSLLAEARRGSEEFTVRAIEALAAVAKAVPDLAGEFAGDVKQGLWSRLDAASALQLASSEVPEFVALAGPASSRRNRGPCRSRGRSYRSWGLGMGTSGAYGGSGKSSWKAAREQLEALAGDAGPGDGRGEAGRRPGGDDGAGETGTAVGAGGGDAGGAASAADLAAAIAAALQRDDPDLRPRAPRVYPTGSLLPSRGGGGRGGGRSGASFASGGSTTAGRRSVSRSAQRGGAALGAAYAYREGNREALRALNLDFDELAALGPRQRFDRILAVVLGDANHPDEYALRRAVAEQMKTILLSETPQSPLEAIRGMIGSLVFQLGVLELRAQRRAGLDLTAVAAAERQLRRWIDLRVRSVGAGLTSNIPVAGMQAAAARILQESTRILRAGRTVAP